MTKRKGRGLAKASLAIIDGAREILQEIQPASVRAVCYRLFTAGLIRNMSKGQTDKVSRLLVRAREEGTIRWEWIVDETRAPEHVNSWDDPSELLASAARQYRKDYWTDQPEWIEVWSEKGTVRGTLKPVLDELGVTFRVMHGYGSATAIYGAAQDSLRGDKLLSILYIGDWDPSGLHMSEVDLPDRVERYDGVVSFERLALTEHDIGDDLPHFDLATKAKDPRHRWFSERYGTRCWELDALSPVVLRQRVHDAIVERLDMDKWARCVQVEAAERESVQKFLSDWRKSILRPAPKYSGGES